ASVWAGEQGAPARIDVESGAPLTSFLAPPHQSVSYVRELGDGRLLVLFADGGPTGGLALYEELRLVRWLYHGGPDAALGLAPGERFALVANQRPVGGAELLGVPLDGSPVVSLLDRQVAAAKGIAVSPDGRTLVWSTCHGRVALAKVGNDRFDAL